MSYLKEFEAELTDLLGDDVSAQKRDIIADFVATRVLQSYKNGLEKGQRYKQRPRLKIKRPNFANQRR